MTETTTDRLARIEARVQAACDAAGRPRRSVRLLGASKTHPPENLLEAHQAGLVLMGESRGQELRDKSRVLPDTIEWHFIGPLQKNKIKYVVGTATMVHAVDSLELGQAIGKRVLLDRERGQDLADMQVLVEVNLAQEPSKAGVHPAQCLELCRQLMEVDGIELRGLMAIPPWSPDPEEVAPWFDQLAGLAAQGRSEGLPLTELSMGMSGDFEVAIRHGATLIRVGTAIFGGR